MPKMRALPRAKRKAPQRVTKKKAAATAEVNPDHEVVVRSLTYHADACTRLATELLTALKKVPAMRAAQAMALVSDSELRTMEDAGIDYNIFIEFPAGNVPDDAGRFATEFLTGALHLQNAINARTITRTIQKRLPRDAQPLSECLPIAPALWYCAVTVRAMHKHRKEARLELDSMIRRARHAVEEVRLLETIYCTKAA